jgi:hypothetical protein
MSLWPVEEIKSMRDSVQPATLGIRAAEILASAGLHPSLVDFLAPFCDVVDGTTLLNGTLRPLPLLGQPEHGMPDLVAWNDKAGWKQFQPDKDYDTFYFCSNTFGDLFGIPVSADGSILRDRVGILWTERYEYQEAKVEWRTFLSRLANEAAMAKFFLRLDEYAWAASALGKPASWQCFSSNVPMILGGPNTIENVAIQSLAVHVSFTLQVIRQARQQATPGTPLAMVELYDESGRLLQ